MKKLVWVAGLLLLLSVVFPNGPKLPTVPRPTPAQPVTPAVTGPTDARIVQRLTGATPEDKARIVSIYTGLATVMRRDAGKLITTTEKWALVQQHTLELAVEQVNKYPQLDEDIEAVFAAAVGTTDVAFVTPAMTEKLITAAETIANSAAAAK
jgi:ribosomal protein L23